MQNKIEFPFMFYSYFGKKMMVKNLINQMNADRKISWQPRLWQGEKDEKTTFNVPMAGMPKC